MNLPKKQPSVVLLFTIPLLFSCQILSRFQSTPADSSQTNQGSGLVLEEREKVPTAEPEPETDPEPQPTATPVPIQTAAGEAPPPLPSGNDGENGDSESTEDQDSLASGPITFISPAGYELTHFADWFVVDTFGQTVITNRESALEVGGNLIDQPIIFIASGDTDGVSAPGLLNTVQRELLLEGQLANVSPVVPLNRPSASGVRTVQRLILPEGRMDVTTEVLVSGDLYTVAIGLLPEGASQNERDSLRLIMESVTLTKNTFDLTAADYGLTAEGLTDLNLALAESRPLPAEPQPISFGVNQIDLEPGNAAYLSFNLVEQTDISLIVSPTAAGLDLTIDLLNGAGESILLGDAFADSVGAGLAERLEDIQLEAGTYSLLVRGYGLTGGPITVELR